MRRAVQRLRPDDALTPASAKFVRQTLAPDELARTDRLAPAPTTEAGPRTVFQVRGMDTLTFSQEAYIVHAPGQTLYVLEFDDEDSTSAPWGNGPAPDNVRLHEIPAQSSNVSYLALNIARDDLCWPATGLAGEVAFTYVDYSDAALLGLMAHSSPFRVPGFTAGVVVSLDTEANVHISPPQVRAVTANIWFPVTETHGSVLWECFHGNGQSVVVLGSARMSSAFRRSPGPWNTMPSAPWMTSYEQATGVGALPGGLGIQAINGYNFTWFDSEVAGLRIQPIRPDAGMDVMGLIAADGDGSTDDPTPYVVTASNVRLATLASTLQSQIGLRVFSLSHTSNPFNNVEGNVSWGDYLRHCQQASFSSLNPLIDDLQACNLASRLARLPDERALYPDWSQILPGVHREVEQNPLGMTANYVPSHPERFGSWISNPGATTGYCCLATVALLTGQVSGEYVLNMSLNAVVDAMVPTTSGLVYSLPEYDPYVDRYLQRAATLPTYATSHSFKDYFTKGFKELKRTAKSLASGTFHAAKDIARDHLAEVMAGALLAL